MRRSISGRLARVRRSAFCDLTLLGLVLGSLVVTGPIPTAGAGPTALRGAASTGLVALEILPANWTLTTGNSTLLTAEWADVPANCSIEPAWFAWTYAAGPVEGTFAPPAGPATNFTAVASSSGTETVEVRAAGTVTCAATARPIVAAAVSNVTVDAPLTVDNLSVVPSATSSDRNVRLTAAVAGGLGPFEVRVAWQDGNTSSERLETGDRVALNHTYSTGVYRPTLRVTDETGAVASSRSPENVDVLAGRDVRIATSPADPEAGLLTMFGASFGAREPNDPPFVECGNGSLVDASIGVSSENFTCVFPRAGPASVRAGLGDPNQGAVTNELDVTVRAPLVATIGAPFEPGEVGRPLAVPVVISGGVSPFSVAVQLGSGNPATVRAVDSDGTAWVPVTSVTPGAFTADTVVTDARGAVTSASDGPIAIAAPLNATVTFAESLTTVGATGTWSAWPTDGVGPFDWAVFPPWLANGSASSAGTAASDAEISWSGDVDPEPAGALAWVLLDSAGAVIEGSSSTERVSSLAGNITLTAVGGRLAIGVSVGGGEPPYSVAVNASDGERWTFSAPSPGDYRWTVASAVGGTLLVRATLADRFGERLATNGTVTLAAETAGSGPGGSDLVWLAVPVGLGAAGVVYLLWRRRRAARTVPARPPPDPETVLREILAPADGADRPTVELLAEEAGVPASTVTATLDRLIAAGRVHSETTPEGEEVLAWEPNPPA